MCNLNTAEYDCGTKTEHGWSPHKLLQKVKCKDMLHKPGYYDPLEDGVTKKMGDLCPDCSQLDQPSLPRKASPLPEELMRPHTPDLAPQHSHTSQITTPPALPPAQLPPKPIAGENWEKYVRRVLGDVRQQRWTRNQLREHYNKLIFRD